jgi:integrase
LGENQLYWLDKLHQTLRVGGFGAGALRNYLMEMRLLFHYYHEKDVEAITEMAAGFKSGVFTAHTLRHTFATHMLDNGCDIHTIKSLLGHSKIETTMVYLHLSQQRRSSLVSPLDALFTEIKHDC